MNCQCNNKEEYVTRYLDINGVRLVFNIMKDHLYLQKDELLKRINDNTCKIEKLRNKINDIEDELHDNYFTKSQIIKMQPDAIKPRQIVDAFVNSQK